MKIKQLFRWVSLWLVLLAACQSSSAVVEANAGSDFEIKVGEAPHFDGCASQGEIVNYKWTIVAAPDDMSQDIGMVLHDNDSACSFELDATMVPEDLGIWTIELEVRDANGNNMKDRVEVEVLP